MDNFRPGGVCGRCHAVKGARTTNGAALSRVLALLAAACIATAVVLAPPASAATAPQTRLREKLDRLHRLCEALGQREREAREQVRQLEIRKSKLACEIRGEAEGINAEDYPHARQSRRIAGNLRLIARILVYQRALEAKIAVLQRSGAELRFLYRRADDDLQLLTAVDSVGVEALVGEIEAALPPYEVEAGQLDVTIEGIAPPPDQIIWQSLMPKP